MINLKNKKVLVVGIGKSGVSAARFVASRGARASILDQRSRLELKSLLKKIPSSVRILANKKRFPNQNFDLIVVSPGVPWDHPDLVSARKKNVLVLPEFELAWFFIKPFKTLAVTGTNGKTTTTALLGEILKKAKKKVVVGGNIGTPLTELTKKITSKTYLILETSSYQIEAHHTFHPNVAIWLNLTPDHLQRHKTMASYAKIKARLFKNQNQDDIAVLNRKDSWVKKTTTKIHSQKIWFPSPSAKKMASHLKLLGEHNQENAMAAALSAKSVGINQASIIKTLKSFKGVQHRLQDVAIKKDILFVNDSKSTNVDSTKVALKSMTSQVILLLGGRHKGTPYTALKPYIKNVRYIFAFGESQNRIAKDLKKYVPVIRSDDLAKAMRLLRNVVRKKDTVLFSPACASFDQYKNFEKRGDHFIQLVKRWKR